MGFERLSQVPVDGRTRLEALGQIAELSVKHAQTRFQISECSRRRRDVSKPLLDAPQVRQQGCHVLHRPVVDVEPEANQTPLRDVEDLDGPCGHCATRLSSRPTPWLYAQRTATARTSR